MFTANRLPAARGAALRPAAVLAALLAAALTPGCRSTESAAPSPAQATPAPAGRDTAAGGVGTTSTQRLAPGEAAPHRALGYKLEWRAFPVTAGTGLQRLTVADDAILALSNANQFTFIEDDTGRNRWSVIAGDRLTKFVGVDALGGTVLISSESEATVYDSATGDLLRRQRLRVLANTPPALVSGMAIYGGSTGEVLGHSLATGFKLWGYQLGAVINADPVVLEGGIVGVVSQGGAVIFLDAETGSSEGRRAAVFDGLEVNPVTDGQRLYVGGLDQSVWAFDAEDARVAWRVRTENPIRTQPAIHNGVLYVTLEREGLVAFNAANGSRLWASADAPGVAVAIRNGRLLVRAGETVARVDPATGDVLDRVTIPGMADLRFDRFEDGDMYVVDDADVVSKFSPSF